MRGLLWSCQAGQGFLLRAQMQRQQRFQREEGAPQRRRHFDKASRRFGKGQKARKPIRQPLDFGMHPQQDTKRVLPT